MPQKMQALSDRVHDIENLNYIVYSEEKDCGGAQFHYGVYNARTGAHIQDIVFQNGPRKEAGTTPGLTDVDILEIVHHRLKAYTKGPYWCEEDIAAACCVYAALSHLKRRTEGRKSRGVLGTYATDNQDIDRDEYLRQEVANQIG